MQTLTLTDFHLINKGWNNKLRVLINSTLAELTLSQFSKLADKTIFDYDGNTYRITLDKVTKL